MLERKAIDHEVKYLLAGSQPLVLRALRFPRGTTPALMIDGRRIQGSREIAAALEEIKPAPFTLPDESRRAALRAGGRAVG